MKKQKGNIILYICVACLIIITIAMLIFIGKQNKEFKEFAKLHEEENSIIQNEPSQASTQIDTVPIYTPQQLAKIGSGEDVYVAETGKVYAYTTDKTYMFYGPAEELTTIVENELSSDIKEQIKTEIREGKIQITFQSKQPEAPQLASNMVAVYWSKDGGQTASITEEGASPIYSKIDANGNPSSTGTVNPNFKEENWYDYKARI